MHRRRKLDPHKFEPRYASYGCLTCGKPVKHWIHRSAFYRMFHSRPQDARARKG